MGRPSAVMRLQAQFAVRVIRGQSLQPVRQSAAIEDPTGTGGRLPETEDRREQLMRIAALLGILLSLVRGGVADVAGPPPATTPWTRYCARVPSRCGANGGGCI